MSYLKKVLRSSTLRKSKKEPEEDEEHFRRRVNFVKRPSMKAAEFVIGSEDENRDASFLEFK